VVVDRVVLEALAARVRVWAPVVAARIPPDVAATLAALALTDDPYQRLGFVAPGTVRAANPRPEEVADVAVVDAVQAVGRSLRERLLHDLAPVAAELRDIPVAGVGALLPEPRPVFAVATSGSDGGALEGVRFLAAMRPGTLAVLRTLFEAVAPLTVVASGPESSPAPEDADETHILATHGAAQLAPAVATALAVLAGPVLGSADPERTTAATIGAAAGLALLALRAVPEPAGYHAAVLARERAEYVPSARAVHGRVQVVGHHFALTEGSMPAGEVNVSATGLAAVVPGGVVVRTGTDDGWVHVMIRVQQQAPSQEPDVMEEVVDLSYRAERGFASVLGADSVPAEGLRQVTPPQAGDYRVRVQASGRDAGPLGGQESYWFTLWPAPPAPTVAHRRTDRLGHRLRGEPESVWPERPELAYAWVAATGLSPAATVTVVTGSTVEQVLRAFGADPDRPQSRQALAESFTADPWVCVLDVGDAVLAVEDNGW